MQSTSFLVLFSALTSIYGQRITTIQLDGVQYFISRMNPYSPELNYFLSYQYCRSLGLQLVSFETKEKADSITQYLKNAGYNKYDFWTSGNKLGTNMLLWMSTGLPFNVTFNYMRVPGTEPSTEMLESTIPLMAPEATGRQADGDVNDANGCVVLKAPDHSWEIDDCLKIKDFICEQTRCYYYNYGSIPVSTSQGNEGHLLNFTRRVTMRPALMRKDVSAEEKEPVKEEVEETESTTVGEEQPTSEPMKQSAKEPMKQPAKEPMKQPANEPMKQSASELMNMKHMEDETYDDAVLGKVSRRKVLDLPTVDRLERKISSSWMFKNQAPK